MSKKHRKQVDRKQVEGGVYLKQGKISPKEKFFLHKAENMLKFS